MAYDKIITIRSRLDHCLDYALNEEKTALSQAIDYGMNPSKTHNLVTGINCVPESAHQEMQATKRRWDKRGGVLGYHIIHSYAPGEVTSEQAHAAGVDFARRLLGDRYEAVVSTHTDREHLHCHIVFNSVSFVDGKKYRSDFQSYFGTLRETSTPAIRERFTFESFLRLCAAGLTNLFRKTEIRRPAVVRTSCRTDIQFTEITATFFWRLL